MKIVVVGGGGREHAIIKKIKQNPEVKEIFAIPGNGGIAEFATCVDIKATDVQKIADYAAKIKADFVVVTPDDPLALGLVDLLQERSIRAFGPLQKSARIESSKVFAKELMKKYHIPTARYEVFADAGKAVEYLSTQQFPIVIKADGLALGKGVIIAQDLTAAKAAIHSIMEEKKFGASGNRVVIEEYLEGPEVSVLSFTDGKTLVPMVASMDHKKAHDGDSGLNTGGMGVIAPNPFYTPEIAERCRREIFLPTIRAMQNEGATFQGCLYFGLMLTADGPKVIEYNCRFGDPETQAVLPLLKTDLLEIMQAVSSGNLHKIDIEFSNASSCTVVMASRGYPESYESGFEISFPPALRDSIDIAGAVYREGKLYSKGGRVLAYTAVADNLPQAVAAAYKGVAAINFANSYYRHDIGKRALAH